MCKKGLKFNFLTPPPPLEKTVHKNKKQNSTCIVAFSNIIPWKCEGQVSGVAYYRPLPPPQPPSGWGGGGVAERGAKFWHVPPPQPQPNRLSLTFLTLLPGPGKCF
jgi:hypothetical protein